MHYINKEPIYRNCMIPINIVQQIHILPIKVPFTANVQIPTNSKCIENS